MRAAVDGGPNIDRDGVLSRASRDGRATGNGQRGWHTFRDSTVVADRYRGREASRRRGRREARKKKILAGEGRAAMERVSISTLARGRGTRIFEAFWPPATTGIAYESSLVVRVRM